MPRKGRGGAREGSAQTAYSNRTDLNNRGPEPITTAPGQTYGQATMQREAQQAVPMAGVQVPPAAPAMQAAPASAAPAMPPAEPGTMPYLHPTDRPDEPITTGLGQGLGAGADATTVVPHEKLSDILGTAAQSPYASPEVRALAEYARMLER
jgi:hypothetical protein